MQTFKFSFFIILLVALFSSFWILTTLPVAAQEIPSELVRDYIWPETEEAFERARFRLERLSNRALSREELNRVERILRSGRQRFEPLPAAEEEGQVVEIEATSANARIPILLSLPPDYSEGRAWPLMVAMHGGPPGSPEQALRGAQRMISVWTEAASEQGWIVAAPAMVGAVSVDEYTRERLPYEIFHPEDFRSVVAEVKRYLRIDSNRVVATGISLGSNFSIAFAAAYPQRLSAIVPVSTEGESRHRLLKNLFAVPTYVLEGAQDSNIRTISVPRALSAILAHEAYDFVYVEMSDRAHEGFQEYYPDVLRWLSSRPRQIYPERLLRSPHAGIVPLSRRLYWVESGDAEGLVRAEIQSSTEIEILAHNTGTVTLHLHDRLVNLDEPVRVTINGVLVHDQPVSRSLGTLLEGIRECGDAAFSFPARLKLEVPGSAPAVARGRQLLEAFQAKIPEGQLSYWEMYAVRALEERVPSLGLEVEVRTLAEELDPLPGQRGLLVKAVEAEGLLVDFGFRQNDLIVRFGDHHFFSDHPRDLLFHLRRELRSDPQSFTAQVWREGKLETLEVALALGPYRKTRESTPSAN